MKSLLLLPLLACLLLCFSVNSQEISTSQTTTTPNSESYMDFRSKNMYVLMESAAIKKEYEQLISIEYLSQTGGASTFLTPEKFIELLNNNALNCNLISIKRDRKKDTWYKLGATGYILIAYAEEKIAKNYSLTNNK